MTTRDYYEALGVSRSASAAEIKAAFRKQAMRWHPDRNPGKDTTAAFKEINEAYACLSNSLRRAQYDRTRPQGQQQRQQGQQRSYSEPPPREKAKTSERKPDPPPPKPETPPMRTAWQLSPRTAYGLVVAAAVIAWPFMPTPKASEPSPVEVALKRDVNEARAATERLERRLEELNSAHYTFYRQWAEARDSDFRDLNRQGASIDQLRADDQSLKKRLDEFQKAAATQDERLAERIRAALASALAAHGMLRAEASPPPKPRPQVSARPVSRDDINQHVSDQLRALANANAGQANARPSRPAPRPMPPPFQFWVGPLRVP